MRELVHREHLWHDGQGHISRCPASGFNAEEYVLFARPGTMQRANFGALGCELRWCMPPIPLGFDIVVDGQISLNGAGHCPVIFSFTYITRHGLTPGNRLPICPVCKQISPPPSFTSPPKPPPKVYPKPKPPSPKPPLPPKSPPPKSPPPSSFVPFHGWDLYYDWALPSGTKAAALWTVDMNFTVTTDPGKTTFYYWSHYTLWVWPSLQD